MIKHAYIASYTLDNHIILYVSQDKKILLTNEYLAVKKLTKVRCYRKLKPLLKLKLITLNAFAIDPYICNIQIITTLHVVRGA